MTGLLFCFRLHPILQLLQWKSRESGGTQPTKATTKVRPLVFNNVACREPTHCTLRGWSVIVLKTCGSVLLGDVVGRCNAGESPYRLVPHTPKAVLHSCHTSYRGLQRGGRACLATSTGRASPQTFPVLLRGEGRRGPSPEGGRKQWSLLALVLPSSFSSQGLLRMQPTRADRDAVSRVYQTWQVPGVSRDLNQPQSEEKGSHLSPSS